MEVGRDMGIAVAGDGDVGAVRRAGKEWDRTACKPPDTPPLRPILNGRKRSRESGREGNCGSEGFEMHVDFGSLDCLKQRVWCWLILSHQVSNTKLNKDSDK